MGVAALILLIVTVLAGTMLLAELAGPGLAASRRLVALMGTHIGLAAIAVVLWLAAVTADSRALAWAGVAVLVAVVVAGSTLFVQAGRPTTPDQPAPGASVPMSVVVIHGAAAAATVVLAVLAALFL